MKRLLVLLAACGDNVQAPTCADYVRPVLPPTGCADPSDATTLVPCDTGGALTGAWAIDGDGLPAYDFLVDERCDDAATAYSPSPRPMRDPLHVVGDGLGTVAMAHASGGLDVYMQDRGGAWPFHVDTWADPQDPAFPPQLGAAVGYVVDGGDVISTRYEDLPIGNDQSRRFGVGYVETVQHAGDLTIARRTYAVPGTRALVTDVTVSAGVARDVEVVELDDANLYELPVELVTSDLLAPGLTDDIQRRRRALAATFTQHASWNGDVAAIATTAKAPVEPPSEVDDHPATVWLASLDGAPDGVWLVDRELWSGADRSPPTFAGDASPRAVDFDGENQPGVLAMRVRVSVPAGGSVTTRFAVGVGDPANAAAVRALDPHGRDVATAWKPRLVWAAVPGQPNAGALQRELAWSSYAAQALATVDESGLRVLGQGGSYKYIHGIDGAIGDFALFAEAMVLIDPSLAADTLAYALQTQRAPDQPDAGRFPYATTGANDFTDMVRYDRRSDGYFLVPLEIARYVALTRDAGFLDRDVGYWPTGHGSVVDHLERAQAFADGTLGFGAHGLVAMGTNDYADGVLQTATEPATETGTSSTFNAGFVALGFSLAHDVLASRDATLAQRYADVRADQVARLEQFGWNGEHYERGFVDSGDPLGADSLYLEPQVLPILAGVVPDDRRTALLDLVATRMDTKIGAMTVVGAAGGPDQPQVGGVWPVSSAWLTEAYALDSPTRGWDSLVRNTLFAHAEAFPHLWYGVTSGPDSYFGPDADRPGEADAHLATALTDYPVFNVHSHVSVLRALVGVTGVHGTAAGIAIAPRLPTETYTIQWPRLSLQSTPTSIAGSVSATGPLELRVRLPSGLRAGTLHATIDGQPAPVTRDGDDAVLQLPGAASWAINAS